MLVACSVSQNKIIKGSNIIGSESKFIGSINDALIDGVKSIIQNNLNMDIKLIEDKVNINGNVYSGDSYRLITSVQNPQDNNKALIIYSTEGK